MRTDTPSSREPSTLWVGVDTGGTFTDVVALRDGVLSSYKLSSTPGAFEEAVLEGSAKLAEGSPHLLMHSTTVATNALLEFKGARTALITSEGFRDVLAIGRQTRPFLYDLCPRREVELVPEALRFELPERVSCTGEVLVPLDLSALPHIIGELKRSGVRSVAVLFLFSFLRPEHEREVGAALGAEGFEVSLSHEVLPEFREVERGSTTVVNAYVAPVMRAYLERLRRGPAESLWIVQSNGGCMTPDHAAAEAAHTLLSGPAAGVLGACTVTQAGGHERNLITFDMGGTSTDVALIRGEPVISSSHRIRGQHIGVPMVDVHTVGAGGGSIARVDAGGALRVGPDSAGAFPGPACYGHGDAPTVTDAHVVLGHLRPEAFLQGRMSLDPERSRAALARLAAEAGAPDAEATARDLLRIVNAQMEAAIRVISVQRGHDPADFTLVGFGGAGGLHVFDLAEALGMRRVLIPCHAGVLSALGCVATPLTRERSQTVMWTWDGTTPALLADLLAELRAHVLEGLKGPARIRTTLAMRYAGQSHELDVLLPESDCDPVALFHEQHARRYGHAEPGETVQLVTVRLRASEPERPLHLPELPPRRAEDGDLRMHAGMLRREDVRRGDVLEGPLLILEDFATHRVPAGWSVRPDAVGNLLGVREVPA